MKTDDQIESLCKKLKPHLGEKADMLWHSYLAAEKIDRRKIVQDIEILAEKILKADALEESEILLPPPNPKKTKGRVHLGETIYNYENHGPLLLQHEDFRKQVGIFAITGEGKTNLAFSLALQLLKQKVPFLVIDWKRSWRSLLSLQNEFPELQNIEVFTVGRDILPFLWNPFRAPPYSDQHQWISTVADALEKSHLSGPGVAYHFEKIYLNLLKGLDQYFFPNFHDGLHAIQATKVSMRELQWKQTAQRIFQSFTIGNAEKVFNTRNPLRIEDLLNKPVILELDMEMPKSLRVFLSEILLRWIHLHRISQGETDKLRHVLFLEEAHNLFSGTTWNKDMNSLENVYREIRAFGQGIITITQHPSLLPVWLLGNCHTQIFLGLQHAADIQEARKSLFLTHEEEKYFNQLRVGECIVKIKNRIEPCHVKTPLIPITIGMVTDRFLQNRQLGAQFRKFTPNFSRKFSGGYSATEKPENDSFQPAKTENSQSQVPQNTPANKREIAQKPPLPENSGHLLEDIFQNPFSGITQRYKRLQFSVFTGNKTKQELLKAKLIKQRNISTNKYRITLFDLTKKAKMILRDLGHEVSNISEGIVHRFWKDHIAEQFRQRGYEIQIEQYYINGRPDIIAEKNGKKVAIEIETGKSDPIKNIRQALEASFDQIISLATSEQVQQKIRDEIETEIWENGKIQVHNIQEFIQRRNPVQTF